ncbi:hypothetical protein PMAYCL1PPCAC_30377 [Pristionchus mayeri]|uniref:Uncharacterized protein n=1 Tax=Pristionchus mayeri TaxID=1317129 RepID=A0AAN5DCR7_9BILA|nr:hypothetical protein PMAYCL1PPCAC_30377 [Pristionchus mayeri]
MRVIYLVRASQLLVTLRALWLLYSVSSFCERTQHSMTACSDMIARIPFATPEEIDEFVRAKNLRSASNRAGAAKNKSNVSSSHQSTTTTTRTPANTESSTVTSPSSTEEVKIRKKRDERKELPGNGMTEGQRKSTAVVVDIKKEEKEVEKKIEEKKYEEKKVEKKVEEKKDEEIKKYEKKANVQGTTPEPILKEEKEVKKEKTEEKKVKPDEKKKEQEPVHSVTETIEEKKIETTTQSAMNEKREEKGAKVEIPVAEIPAEITETPKEEKLPKEKKSGDKTEETHHTVKKDLKAHVQEPVKVEEKKPSTGVPKLAPAQKNFVVHHSDAFLQEVRCLEVTSDDYFGSQASPFAEHLKGLLFAGPVMVVISVYLVCSIMRRRLSHETPNEFLSQLGVAFHMGMWLVVALSMFFIANHWSENWHTVSNNTFAPEFPCAWYSLIMLSSLMMFATSLELWFQKRLNYDIVFERAYRCYEVIDNSESVQNQGQFSRTNVY